MFIVSVCFWYLQLSGSCLKLIYVFFSSQLSEKERETINRIEIARGEIAIEWEDRLMEEMCRLKLELEQCHLDDRNVALNELREEALIATQVLTTKFKEREQELVDEVDLILIC